MRKTSSEIIHKNQWWEYKKDQIIRPDGSSGEYYYIETAGNALVVPVLDDGRLVLARQHRYLSDRHSVEFPGGGIGPGETPSEGALRELREETGYTADNLIKVGCFEPDIGVVKDESHVFIAHDLSLVAQPVVNAYEQTEVLVRRVDEFEEMIKRGDIWDGQVLAVWALVRDMLRNHA
jgi:ADP-ribose pyrophosphatase